MAGPALSSMRHQATSFNSKQSRVHSSNNATRSNPIYLWLWRRWMWLMGTVPLALLETWERLTLLLIAVLLSSLVLYSVIFHLPDHLRLVLQKSAYYIVGTPADRSLHDGLANAAAVTVGHVSQLAKDAAGSVASHDASRRWATEL